MELKSKGIYRCPQFDLYEGQTTEGFEISEAQKTQMLADFPELFDEVVTHAAQDSKESGTEGSELEGTSTVKKGKK